MNRQSVLEWCPKGTKIYPRKGSGKKFGVGLTTGTLRDCTLEGCTGVKVGVRWPDGHITWICTKGLDAYRKGFIIL